jgi:hypothetical protein
VGLTVIASFKDDMSAYWIVGTTTLYLGHRKVIAGYNGNFLRIGQRKIAWNPMCSSGDESNIWLEPPCSSVLDSVPFAIIVVSTWFHINRYHVASHGNRVMVLTGDPNEGQPCVTSFPTWIIN